MPTQEDRITALEQIFLECRPVLQSVAYELTMVKGIIMDQSSSIHALCENMQGAQEGTKDIQEDIKDIKKRLDTMDRIEEKLNLILTFLKPS